MKKIILFTILLSSLFGYKDTFYIGAFTAVYKGNSTLKENEIEYPNGTYIDREFTVNGQNNGIRFGEDTNSNKEHTSKMRLEISYEPRTYKFKSNGKELERKGHRLAASMYLGYNLDLLLTHETTIFAKMSFGYNDVEVLEKGTDQVFGVGGIYTTRLFDFQIGYDREFRSWGAYKLIPYDYFVSKNHSEEVDTIYGGINIKF